MKQPHQQPVIPDRVNSGEVEIKYCPTGMMIADFFTKPLQGTAYITFRDFIMNADHDSDRGQDHRSVLESQENKKNKENTPSVYQPDVMVSNDAWIEVRIRKNKRNTSAELKRNKLSIGSSLKNNNLI